MNAVKPGVLPRFTQCVLGLDAQRLLAKPLCHLSGGQLEFAVEAIDLAIGAVGDVVLASREDLATNAVLEVVVDPDDARSKYPHFEVGNVHAVVEVGAKQYITYALGSFEQPGLDRPELHSLFRLHHQVKPWPRARGKAAHHAGGQRVQCLSRPIVDDLVVAAVTLVDLLITQQS
ncbi:hypothetical protein D3C81_1338650 [compost metagenome]